MAKWIRFRRTKIVPAKTHMAFQRAAVCVIMTRQIFEPEGMKHPSIVTRACGPVLGIARLFVVVLIHGLSAACSQLCPDENRFLPGTITGELKANRYEAISGVSASKRNPGVLWVHNGGSIKQIFAINAAGRSLGTFTLDQQLTDVQDIAVGPGPDPNRTYVYIADIGDPSRNRQSVAIIRCPEPEVDPDPERQPNVPLADQTTITLNYPDEPHDARAIVVDPVSGELLLFTHEMPAARLFIAKPEQLASGSATLSARDEIQLVNVTAGDVSADGREVIARNETQAFLWPRPTGQSVAESLLGAARSIPLPSDPTGGTLAFDATSAGYLTIGPADDPPIYYFKRNNTRFAAGQKLGVATSSNLTEVSGIVASRANPGIVWVHNDGGVSEIFAIQTNGLFLATFAFNEPLTDCEDIAVGPGPQAGRSYLYAGDIGDNTEERSNIRILRTPEPVVPQSPAGGITEFAEQEVFTLEYPDGPQDAEALLVDPITGDVYIVTKEQSRFRLYRCASQDLDPTRTSVLELVHTGSFSQVSAGDISDDGRRIILRREEAARLWMRQAGESIADAFQRAGEEIPVTGPPEEPNGEGIAFVPNGEGYYTISEGKEPPLYLFLPLETPGFLLPLQRAATGWTITIRGCPGTTLTIAGSSDLQQWQPLTTVTLQEPASSIVDTNTEPSRFYRLTE